MKVRIDTSSMESYAAFLRIKSLPKFKFTGRTAEFPYESAAFVGNAVPESISTPVPYSPIDGLFDYQLAITRLAIEKQKFGIFADCGLGKTMMFLEYARYVASVLPPDKCVLIISPLMVIKQTLAECHQFYSSDQIHVEPIRANQLTAWLQNGEGRIGITNYDALTDATPQGRIGCLILDESSMLKSQYGKWGTTCIRLGKGLDWKLACTGTPAPNDRIEY